MLDLPSLRTQNVVGKSTSGAILIEYNTYLSLKQAEYIMERFLFPRGLAVVIHLITMFMYIQISVLSYQTMSRRLAVNTAVVHHYNILIFGSVTLKDIKHNNVKVHNSRRPLSSAQFCYQKANEGIKYFVQMLPCSNGHLAGSSLK